MDTSDFLSTLQIKDNKTAEGYGSSVHSRKRLGPTLPTSLPPLKACKTEPLDALDTVYVRDARGCSSLAVVHLSQGEFF